MCRKSTAASFYSIQCVFFVLFKHSDAVLSLQSSMNCKVSSSLRNSPWSHVKVSLDNTLNHTLNVYLKKHFFNFFIYNFFSLFWNSVYNLHSLCMALCIPIINMYCGNVQVGLIHWATDQLLLAFPTNGKSTSSCPARIICIAWPYVSENKWVTLD